MDKNIIEENLKEKILSYKTKKKEFEKKVDTILSDYFATSSRRTTDFVTILEFSNKNCYIKLTLQNEYLKDAGMMLQRKIKK